MDVMALVAAFIQNTLGPKIKEMTPRLLPTGGATGQVLAKTSATNYAAAWQTPPDATTAAAGLMSASDKTKLNRLVTSTNVTVSATAPASPATNDIWIDIS